MSTELSGETLSDERPQETLLKIGEKLCYILGKADLATPEDVRQE